MAGELYSIEEARALLGGIARNTLYDLLRSGALASVPIGRRRFIAAEAIAAFIANASTTNGPLRGPLRGAGPADGGSAEPSSRERRCTKCADGNLRSVKFRV